MRDATKVAVCRRLAGVVVRQRDKGWPGVGPAWRWLVSDIERDRPMTASGS